MRKVLHLLGILDDADVEWIAQHGTREHVSAGTELIREKMPIERLYILLDGELAACVKSLGGKQIATLHAGEIVGELSFVDHQPPSATVIALTDAWLLSISREILSVRLAKDNAFAARFYRSIAMFLSDRLRVTVRRLGYGETGQNASEEELVDATLEDIALAAVRFDKMLRKLRAEYKPIES